MQAGSKSPSWLAVLVALAVVAWRLDPAVPGSHGPLVGGIASAVAGLCAAMVGLRDPDGSRRLLPVIALLAAITAALRLPGDMLWPCEWRCHGARRYALLVGVPVELLATGACALWALASLRAWRIARPLTWMLAGASLLYLGIAVALAITSGSTCSHCLATHTVIFSGALLSMRDRYHWRLRVLTVITTSVALGAFVWSTTPTQPTPVAPDPSGLGAPPLGPDDRP